MLIYISYFAEEAPEGLQILVTIRGMETMLLSLSLNF